MHIGPYEVLEEVAKGGMGVVYRAHDPRVGREVALKVLLRSDRSEQIERLMREAESLARLRHPNIVRVHGVVQHEGCPVLVMEWVAGESLQERLDRQGPLEPAEAVVLARALAEALAYAHGQGVLHRDLKPANVLIDERGEPKLTDFGIAQLIDDQGPRLSQTGAMVGSPEYFAPEQAFAKRERIGPWTDVYGLGGTLYAALTGGPPFKADSLAEYAILAARREPDPPSTRAADVDPGLDAVCLRCLAKEPEDRFESAADLADALAQELAGAGRGAELSVLALGALVFLLGLVSALVVLLKPAPEPVASAPSEVAPVAPVATVAGGRGVDRPAGEAWMARARARIERAELHAARTAVERALQVDPESADAYGLRASILFRLGRGREARADIARAEALGGSAEADCARAVGFSQQDRFRAALAALDSALRRDPNHLDALLARSAAHSSLKQLARAVRDLRRALKLAPRDPRCHLRLGRVLVELDRPREALPHFDRALALKPGWLRALWNRGAAHSLVGNREVAVRDFEQALAIDSKHAEARYYRGMMRKHLKDYRGAVEDFDVALTSDPDHLDALCARAESLLRLGKFARVELDLNRVLRRDAHKKLACLLMTQLRIEQKRYPEAYRWADRVVQREPHAPGALLLRGKALYYLRRFSEAIADLGKAHAWFGERLGAKVNCLDYRSRCYAALEQYAAAAADVRRILSMFRPGNRYERNTRFLLAKYEELARAQAAKKTKAKD